MTQWEQLAWYVQCTIYLFCAKGIVVCEPEWIAVRLKTRKPAPLQVRSSVAPSAVICSWEGSKVRCLLYRVESFVQGPRFGGLLYRVESFVHEKGLRIGILLYWVESFVPRAQVRRPVVSAVSVLAEAVKTSSARPATWIKNPGPVRLCVTLVR